MNESLYKHRIGFVYGDDKNNNIGFRNNKNRVLIAEVVSDYVKARKEAYDLL